MSMFSRMSTIVKAKMNRILDNVEDPGEALDYSYEKQLEMLQNVKRGIVEMATARKLIQQSADKVRGNIVRLERQARQSLDAGREDLARLALQNKQESLYELESLNEQIASMEHDQEKLTLAEQRLQAKVDDFRNHKEVIKAQYSAAQAQTRIGSVLAGISEEMGDVSLAVQRAETRTERMRAKAGAIEELAAAGVLEGIYGGQDDIERQLSQITAYQNVEDELAALKGPMSPAPASAPIQRQLPPSPVNDTPQALPSDQPSTAPPPAPVADTPPAPPVYQPPTLPQAPARSEFPAPPVYPPPPLSPPDPARSEFPELPVNQLFTAPDSANAGDTPTEPSDNQEPPVEEQVTLDDELTSLRSRLRARRQS